MKGIPSGENSMRLWLQPWLRRGLFLAALACLGYSGWVLADAHRCELYRAWGIKRLRSAAAGLHLVSLAAAAATTTSVASHRPPEGSVVGLMEIPRLGIQATIVEGDAPTARPDVTHIPGTALPGEAGIVGLAVNGDDLSQTLRALRLGDTLALKTQARTYRYRVDGMEVVPLTSSRSLQTSPQPSLTLVTGLPSADAGQAFRRFVVHARLVGSG